MDNERKTSAIIMAAGRGSRMKSDTPKVLHRFRGRTLLERVVDAARGACDDVAVVVGHSAALVASHVPPGVRTILQPEQKGTGHAVLCALADGVTGERIIVLPGDHPLLKSSTIRSLAKASAGSAAVTLATLRVPNFGGAYDQFRECGRIARDDQGRVAGIVEYRDASDGERSITEVNVSCYAFNGAWLREHIGRLVPSPSGEYYLTDLVAIAVRNGKEIRTHPLADWREAIGINTVEHLMLAEQAAAA